MDNYLDGLNDIAGSSNGSGCSYDGGYGYGIDLGSGHGYDRGRSCGVMTGDSYV